MANAFAQSKKLLASIPLSSLAGVVKSSMAKAGSVGKSISRRIVPIFSSSWVALYVAICLVGAQVALLTNPILGAYINAAAFIALISLGLIRVSTRQLSISAAILPVVNMVSLSLPQSSTFAQTMVFYGALLLIALVYRFVFTLDHPLTYTKVSVKGYATALPMMIVIGEVLGVIGYGLLRNHYIYGHVSLSLIAGCSVIFAFAEEAFFRGLIQQRASLIVNPVLAMLLSVVTYTAVSIDHTTILAPVFALISGIVLSFVYYKKQNILLTFVLNATMKLTYVGLLASFIFIRSRIFY